MTDRSEITRNQLHASRRAISRMQKEIDGLKAVAIAKRELHADIVSLREDMAEIKAAALAGNLRDVVRIVDDATARRERTREQRKVKADE
jgi:uncharacterized protein YbjQ (UPF0145 family)